VPIEHLVLVVGAGASRNLSSSSETPMPLMEDWNEVLRRALTEQDSALPGMVGIHYDQAGPEFEKAIGDFLTWQRSLDLSARYLPLGMETLQPFDANQWRLRAISRAESVVATLRRTLYDEFGQDRISTIGAKAAYQALFDSLDLVVGGSVVVATTNYDPAVELALAELRRKPRVGEVPGPGGLTFLDPQNLIGMCRADQSIPVLHLHGKVGWYTQEDESIQIHAARPPYNETAGTPTVLWPDPDKDPTVEPGILELWNQFDLALEQASHILVIGHSLHDPILVNRIRRTGRAHRAVATFTPEDNLIATKLLPEATLLPGTDFGPSPDLEQIKEWGGRS
jgi:hypothetical protein